MTHRIDTQYKGYDRFYGLSSVPTTWRGRRVRITGQGREQFILYLTKSGWLVSKLITTDSPGGWMSSGAHGERLADPAYKSKAGAGGYGYDSEKGAITAFIEQKLN